MKLRSLIVGSGSAVCVYEYLYFFRSKFARCFFKFGGVQLAKLVGEDENRLCVTIQIDQIELVAYSGLIVEPIIILIPFLACKSCVLDAEGMLKSIGEGQNVGISFLPGIAGVLACAGISHDIKRPGF